MTVELAKQALAEGVAAVHDDDKCTCTDAYGPTAPYCEETMRANEAARYRIANARTREPLLAQAVLDLSAQLDCQYKHATALHQVEQRSFEQRQDLTAQLKAMTACRDELAKIAAAREHPDRFPDFDVSLERIGKLRRVGHPAATVAAKWAACEEPPEGNGVRACNWTGEMSRLVTDDFGVTHCPGCGSTALKEDISP